MNDREPLLKDEVETFGFLQETKKNKKPNKNDKRALITTVVFCLIVGFFTIKWTRVFYIGFKYFDEGRIVEKKSDEPVKDNTNEEEVSLNSYLLDKVYRNIYISQDIITNIYSDTEVNIDGLSDTTKLSILFNSYLLNCENATMNISYEELEKRASEFFEDISFLSTLQNTISLEVNSYSISKVDENNFNIVLNVCDNYIVERNIKNALHQEDELYVYEDALLNGEIKEYKWTFKKSNDTYYMRSVTPG